MPSISKKISFIISAQFVFSVCHSQAVQNYMPMTQKESSEKVAVQQLPDTLTALEQKIAQKMVVDIRYFCDDANSPLEGKTNTKHCRKAVTELPTTLSDMITDSNVGGIVLFAENVVETEQIVKLTHEIQTAALKSIKAKPIIIAIDQEGGRVARFAKMTGFSGNMAIGATYKTHGTYFATQVNTVLGKELNALGINNNYAPVVDVNTNANNPVINTRSYGENAQHVAKLGVAAVGALQAQGIMATLKHFPGHGDTHVDSHIGLPNVDHDLATIEDVDLAPFALAIDKTNPAMIMTAHIQYPTLDNTHFTAKSGEQLIRPATMSRKILTDLLRKKMAFDGIIATDALDMAGISHYFTAVEAVVETFIAGADLAVMPFKIRKPEDIHAFKVFIKEVAQALSLRIKQGDYSNVYFEQSLTRLERYKNQYVQLPEKTLTAKILNAQTVVANAEHLNVEQGLANAAITVLQGNIQQLLNQKNNIKRVHLVVANEQELSVLTDALEKAWQHNEAQGALNMPQLSHFIAEDDFEQLTYQANIKQADVVIATIDVKTASLVDIGGMDDLSSTTTRSYGSELEQQKKRSYAQLLTNQLTSAKKHNVVSILIAKGSPYLLSNYRQLAEVILLNFDDRTYLNAQQQLISPGFNAAMALIFSQHRAHGHLPISLEAE